MRRQAPEVRSFVSARRMFGPPGSSIATERMSDGCANSASQPSFSRVRLGAEGSGALRWSGLTSERLILRRLRG